ncbi:exopolysaccharide biosynthesis protein [Prochlorothrix hollandica]|uniref:exopolysaccharide biosynthesis protein n=1 Tax=Prochlorothrix hollandica TaxID=1223 RepID=UPI00333E3CB2
MAKLSTDLNQFFFDQDRGEMVTLADLLEFSGERAFGVLFVLTSFPSALPLPAPGYSTPFGLLIFLLAGQMILGRDTPWFPAKWLQWSVPLAMTQKVLKLGLPWLSKLETITRPRFTFLCTHATAKVVIGCALALMGISMMITIPGTNTLPAMGVFVTGFSLIEDDGAVTLAGLTLCLMGFILSTGIIIALVFFGSNFVDVIKGWLG